MKWIQWVVSVLLMSACSRATSFDLTVKGTLQGQAVDAQVHVATEAATSGTLGNDDPRRDVAPLLVLAGGTDTRSTVSGTCSPGISSAKSPASPRLRRSASSTPATPTTPNCWKNSPKPSPAAA